MVERRFAEPVTWVEEALEALSAEVGRLLEARGEGGRAFEAAFFRTDGKVLRLGLETGRPTRDPNPSCGSFASGWIRLSIRSMPVSAST
jgi:protein ImuB